MKILSSWRIAYGRILSVSTGSPDLVWTQSPTVTDYCALFFRCRRFSEEPIGFCLPRCRALEPDSDREWDGDSEAGLGRDPGNDAETPEFDLQPERRLGRSQAGTAKSVAELHHRTCLQASHSAASHSGVESGAELFWGEDCHCFIPSLNSFLYI